jgi:hypothetical protein
VPDAVAASELLERAASAIGLPSDLLAEIFAGVPIDFPVLLSPALPFGADRLGMIGITLGGRVHLLSRVVRGDPADLIVLLRHEAEHVRQQREDRFFYVRYVWGWLGGFIRPPREGTRGGLAGRWRRAYIGIAAEREAYEADARARAVINRK